MNDMTNIQNTITSITIMAFEDAFITSELKFNSPLVDDKNPLYIWSDKQSVTYTVYDAEVTE
jgi:hypothetical protein